MHTHDADEFGFGPDSLWKSLVAECTEPGARSGAAAEALVLDWINAGRLRAVYAGIPLDQGDARIHAFIQGTFERFTRLPGIDPAARVLFLFGCIGRERDWLRGVRRLWPVRYPPAPTVCEPLAALTHLTRQDLRNWLDRLGKGLAGIDWDTHRRLSRNLEPLFKDDACRVRYQTVQSAALDLLRGTDPLDPAPGDPP